MTETQPETVTPVTPETAEAEDRVISLNNKQYLYSSLSEEQQSAFEQAMQVNAKIEVKRVEIRDLTYARQYLIDFLEKDADSFTDVTPEAEATEAEAETTETTETTEATEAQ